MHTSKYMLGALPFFLLTASALAGCGPGDSSSSADGTGGSMASGGAGTGGSATGGAGTGGSATGGAGTGGVASTTKSGQVAFWMNDFATHFIATFNDDPPTVRNCVEVKSDGCSAWTCDDAPVVEDLSDPDAGTVTFTSADVAGSATAIPSDTGFYTTNDTFEAGFAGGEKGHFSATGGEVPAFEQDLDIPLALLLDQPLYAKGGAQNIPRSSDLTLQWSRGAEGVDFYMQASSDRPDGHPGSAGFTCTFPSAAGSAVIPSNILSTVASGTIPYVFTIRRAPLTLGDYSVTVWTGFPVYNGTKDQVVQPTIQ